MKPGRPLALRRPGSPSSLSFALEGYSGHGFVSAPDFHDWHDQSTAFEAMAYYQDDDVAVTAGPHSRVCPSLLTLRRSSF